MTTPRTDRKETTMITPLEHARELVAQLLDTSKVRHREAGAVDTFTECLLCGGWDGCDDACPSHRLAAWLDDTLSGPLSVPNLGIASAELITAMTRRETAATLAAAMVQLTAKIDEPAIAGTYARAYASALLAGRTLEDAEHLADHAVRGLPDVDNSGRVWRRENVRGRVRVALGLRVPGLDRTPATV